MTPSLICILDSSGSALSEDTEGGGAESGGGGGGHTGVRGDRSQTQPCSVLVDEWSQTQINLSTTGQI